MSEPTGIPMAKPQEADPRAADRLKRRLRIIQQMKEIQHKIIVGSGKGGVGKSSVATNLACALASKGFKVGLLDMDLTGPNVPTMLGIRGAPISEGQDGGLVPVAVTPNLHVVSMQFLLQDPDQAVVWRGPIKMQVIQQFLGDVSWGALDYLIVDLPPGSSDEPLSVAQNIPDADGFLLVTTPQEVAVGDVRKSASFAQKLNMPILGIIENMNGLSVRGTGPAGATITVDAGLGPQEIQVADDGTFETKIELFQSEGARVLADKVGVPYLGSLPMDLQWNRMADAGRNPFLDGVSTPATDAMMTIVESLLAVQAT